MADIVVPIEILTTVYARENATVPALTPIVLLHLVLLQRRTTGIASEKDHVAAL
jgi:hypothetical protein